MRYDVVIVGYKLGASIKPAEALHQVLGLDLEAAKAMTQAFPAAVVTGLSLSRAESIGQQLSECGAKVEVRASGAPASAADGHGADTRLSSHGPSNPYALGDILAPTGRARSGATSHGARPELDTKRDGSRPQTAPAAVSARPEHDAAFAGIRNFDPVDGYTDSASALDVDEVAFRSIQRRPESREERRAREPSVWQRLGRWSLDLASGILQLGISGMWLALIALVTLLAVGYALDPSDVLGALKREALPAETPRR